MHSATLRWLLAASLAFTGCAVTGATSEASEATAADVNRIHSLELNRDPRGFWTARVTYTYTGTPENAAIEVKVAAPSAHGPGVFNRQGFGRQMVQRGRHTVELMVHRPAERRAIAATRVVAEMVHRPDRPPLAKREVDQAIEWPTMAAGEVDSAFARGRQADLAQRMDSLIANGSNGSLLHAQDVARRILHHAPNDPGAKDALARVAAKAPWTPTGIARLDTSDRIAGAAMTLIREQGFEELDELAKNLQGAGAVTTNGHSALGELYVALGDDWLGRTKTPEQWASVEEILHRWVAAIPQSPVAGITLAIVYQTRAWQARGTGYAHTVSPEAWQEFRLWQDKARKQLAACREWCQADAQWYVMRMSVLSSRDETAEFVQAFAEGARAFPRHQPLYMVMAAGLTPRWGGSVEAFDHFARQVAEQQPFGERDLVYARVYGKAQIGVSMSDGPASAWKVDCKRWMRGHDLILKNYPTDFNANRAAYAAHACSDKQAARRFIAAVREPDLRLWGWPRETAATNFAQAKAWAEAP